MPTDLPGLNREDLQCATPLAVPPLSPPPGRVPLVDGWAASQRELASGNITGGTGMVRRMLEVDPPAHHVRFAMRRQAGPHEALARVQALRLAVLPDGADWSILLAVATLAADAGDSRTAGQLRRSVAARPPSATPALAFYAQYFLRAATPALARGVLCGSATRAAWGAFLALCGRAGPLQAWALFNVCRIAAARRAARVGQGDPGTGGSARPGPEVTFPDALAAAHQRLAMAAVELVAAATADELDASPAEDADQVRLDTEARLDALVDDARAALVAVAQGWPSSQAWATFGLCRLAAGRLRHDAPAAPPEPVDEEAQVALVRIAGELGHDLGGQDQSDAACGAAMLAVALGLLARPAETLAREAAACEQQAIGRRRRGLRARAETPPAPREEANVASGISCDGSHDLDLLFGLLDDLPDLPDL